MTPEDVLARMAMTYARCKSYRDAGVTTHARCQANSKPDQTWQFTTASTGVSAGTACYIPALLLPPEVGARRLTDISGPRRIADGTLEAIDCLRIVGRFGSGQVTLWIASDTFLLRRIEVMDGSGPECSLTVTTYQPVVNELIRAALLEFNPPQTP